MSVYVVLVIRPLSFSGVTHSLGKYSKVNSTTSLIPHGEMSQCELQSTQLLHVQYIKSFSFIQRTLELRTIKVTNIELNLDCKCVSLCQYPSFPTAFSSTLHFLTTQTKLIKRVKQNLKVPGSIE